MSLSDELQKLEELHQKGTLSKEEFEKAKAAVLAGGQTPQVKSAPTPSSALPPKQGGMLDPKANLRALLRIVILVVILLATVWFVVKWTAGEKAANRIVATVTHSPVSLRDETENIPASSWKALPLNLPYTGTLAISLTVVQGNPMDVFVMDEANLAKFKAKGNFQHASSFAATQTKSYNRSARLNQGVYYLILTDKTLGILSASASDVKVTARLSP